MNRLGMTILAGAVLLLILIWNSLFIVDQREQAILLQFGKPVEIEPGVPADPLGPGLHFKIPFIQRVVVYDTRIQVYDADPKEIITLDKKTLVVDSYAKWRIVDPLRFYNRVTTISRAQERLKQIIYSDVLEALGRYNMHDIVATARVQIMDEVIRNSQVEELGIEVIDVRIKRTDLPPENENAIFERMRAEREQQAKQYRSEGDEEYAIITSDADKQRTVILAEAQRQAAIARGEGDANATRIYAEALSQDPDFYAFQRSLEAYVAGLQDNTRIILSPSDSEFLHFFQTPR